MTRRSTLGGGLPIGTQLPLTDLGPTITLGDNSTWLRSGVLTTPASAPQLAAISGYRVCGQPMTTAPAQAVLQVAGNGSGTYVAVLANGSSLAVSTDNGATWATYASPGSYSFGGVVWTGARFIICGAAASTVIFYYSTTGLSGSWIVGGSGAASSSSLYTQNIRGVWTGTRALFTVSSTIPFTTIFWTTDGSNCTNVGGGATPANMVGDSNSSPYMMSANGAGGVLMTCAASGNYAPSSAPQYYYWSTDHGSTWAQYGSGTTGLGFSGGVLCGTSIVLSPTYQSGYSSSFSGTFKYVFVAAAAGGALAQVPVSTLQIQSIWGGGAAGSKVYALGNSGAGYTAIELNAGLNGVASVRSLIGYITNWAGDRAFNFTGVLSTSWRYESTFTSYDYVGMPAAAVVSGGAGSTITQTIYVKAK